MQMFVILSPVSQAIICRFGDFKACSDEDLGGEPDIVCMTDNGEARFIGEAKAPWVHFLAVAMENPSLRRTWLGN